MHYTDIKLRNVAIARCPLAFQIRSQSEQIFHTNSTTICLKKDLIFIVRFKI